MSCGFIGQLEGLCLRPQGRSRERFEAKLRGHSTVGDSPARVLTELTLVTVGRRSRFTYAPLSRAAGAAITDAAPIPLRHWLQGTDFRRTMVSALTAAGGVGKTARRSSARTLALREALPQGRPLSGRSSPALRETCPAANIAVSTAYRNIRIPRGPATRGKRCCPLVAGFTFCSSPDKSPP
jgi:hypothetical protein